MDRYNSREIIYFFFCSKYAHDLNEKGSVHEYWLTDLPVAAQQYKVFTYFWWWESSQKVILSESSRWRLSRRSIIFRVGFFHMIDDQLGPECEWLMFLLVHIY